MKKHSLTRLSVFFCYLFFIKYRELQEYIARDLMFNTKQKT